MDAFRQQIGREQVAATRFRGDDGGIIADAPENSRAIASIPSLQRSNEVKFVDGGDGLAPGPRCHATEEEERYGGELVVRGLSARPASICQSVWAVSWVPGALEAGRSFSWLAVGAARPLS